MPELSTILTYLQFVDVAAIAVCDKIDKAIELEHEERHVLNELREAIYSLKSDTMVYRDLLNAMENDTDLSDRSPCIRFIQQQDGKEAMENLERVLKATQLLFEENPTRNRREVIINPSKNEKPRRALNVVLNILKANLRPGRRQELIGDLKDAIYGIFVCQQNNQRAFKFVWNLYIVAQQWTGRPSSVDNVENIQGRVKQALDSVTHAFHDRPFAVSQKGESGLGLSTFAILNQNHEIATRHENLARGTGKAWVDKRFPKYNARGREIDAFQTSLFGLLCDGTVERLKRHGAYSSDDPEGPEFEKAVEELEKTLQEEMVRSKEQRFVIAFCGMVNAGKSLFLNALMGRAILPTDEIPSTAWPCRLRHVEGQTVPELQFQAEPFLAALKKLQAHQYGQRMQNYQLPPDKMFEARLSDAPSEPSDEENLLRTIYSQWIDLYPVTRDNLLKFETSGFKLPGTATGEENVKDLLGQLNDIVRLCQRFDLKFDMSEGDWPLLTVEFNSLRGHRIDDIYEIIDLPDIGEGFSNFDCESLLRRVASDSNVIVPVVSFKQIHRSDWKRLPELVARGFKGRAEVVVCTHLDQVSQENMDKQLKFVTETFWPRGVSNTNRVIPCSALIGLSARDLLDRSNRSKPPFKAIWEKSTVGYHCAAKILGVGDPQATYDRFDAQMWRDKLEAELSASGLPAAIQKLTEEMVNTARVKTLLGKADTVMRQLREMSNVYERKRLLEALRIKTECDAATRRYDQAREMSETVSETWSRIELMQTQEIRSLLEQELGMISQQAYGLTNQVIEKILPDCGMSLEGMDVGYSTPGASSGAREFGGVQLGNGDRRNIQGPSSAEAGYNNVLITGSKAQAKDFLRLSQRELSSVLETLKRGYAAIILDLVGAENTKLLKVVRGMIKQAELPPLPEDWENRIGELVPTSLHIYGLAFQEIRRVINSRQLSLFNRQYSIGIDALHEQFKDGIIDPWIRSLKEEGEKTLLGATEAGLQVAKKLVTSAFLEKEDRCKRKLEKTEMINHAREQNIARLTAVCSDLWAAEGALTELSIRLKGWRTQSGP